MNIGTRPRDILAANLRALMAKHPDLDTLPKITARSGVTNGTLDRIRRAVVATRRSPDTAKHHAQRIGKWAEKYRASDARRRSSSAGASTSGTARPHSLATPPRWPC